MTKLHNQDKKELRKYVFNKLIRDKIPARMEEEGVIINSAILSDDEYISELKNKIVEEAQEVQESSSKESLLIELADVMEVLYSIAKESDISLEEIESARIEKAKINGRFLPENFINYIEVESDNYKVINYLEDKNRHYKC